MTMCRIEEAKAAVSAGLGDTYQFVDCENDSQADWVRLPSGEEVDAKEWMKRTGLNSQYGTHSDVGVLGSFVTEILTPLDQYLNPKQEFPVASPFESGVVQKWCAGYSNSSLSVCQFGSGKDLAANFLSRPVREERGALFIQRANELMDRVARNHGDYNRLAIDANFERSFVSEPFQYYTRAARTLLGRKTEELVRLEARFEAYRAEKERIGLEIIAHISNLHDLAVRAQDRGIGEEGEAPSLAAISLRQRLDTFERLYPGLLEAYRSLEDEESLEGASKIRFALNVAGKSSSEDVPLSIRLLLERDSDLKLSGS